MTPHLPLRIDFVSDVACPWCAIGLSSLQQALAELDGAVQSDIHLQPFELEPQMPLEGENAARHLMHKYAIDAQRLEANRTTIRARAASLGVTINHAPDTRIYNTFAAHRLLYWAGLQDRVRALALKQALFHAYFAANENVAKHAVLVRVARKAGLNTDKARGVLESGQFAEAVRRQEEHYHSLGIHSVPATILNGHQLILGSQPPETFEEALREAAAGTVES